MDDIDALLNDFDSIYAKAAAESDHPPSAETGSKATKPRSQQHDTWDDKIVVESTGENIDVDDDELRVIPSSSSRTYMRQESDGTTGTEEEIQSFLNKHGAKVKPANEKRQGKKPGLSKNLQVDSSEDIIDDYENEDDISKFDSRNYIFRPVTNHCSSNMIDD